MVLPDGILSMENGDPQEFDIEVHDVSGNLTTQPKLQVVCKVRFHKNYVTQWLLIVCRTEIIMYSAIKNCHISIINVISP